MTTGRALLLFPLRPGAAATALEESMAGCFVAPLPGVAAAAYLFAQGCSLADAAAAGAALVLLVCGLGLFGAAGSAAAALLHGRPFRFSARVSPCLAAATWAPILFALLLTVINLAGLTGEAALLAGMLLLVWGVAAGIPIVGAAEAERGRALVLSCVGLSGALAGLWLALSIVQETLVIAVPAPITAAGFERGDVLLVRRRLPAPPGSIVLLRQPESREAVLARREGGSGLVPLGDPNTPLEELRKWDVAGRVFFKMGAGGTSVVGNPGQSG